MAVSHHDATHIKRGIKHHVPGHNSRWHRFLAASGGADALSGDAEFVSISLAAGPVWSIVPRTLAAAPTHGVPVLASIRTGQHGAYERIVFQFTAAYSTAKVFYVPVVRADPSGKVVALQGASFLQVVVQRAVAHWNATPITPYTGPSTVTPGYPTVKQVSISGDFEAVLSFGVGLDRTAGFQVERLQSPDRLVVDVAERPAWQMWPDDNLAMAQSAQTGFDQGHQSWRGSGASVASSYAFAVYGWNSPVVARSPELTATVSLSSTHPTTSRSVRSRCSPPEGTASSRSPTPADPSGTNPRCCSASPVRRST
ncbi:MAG: AMIN-like domain-containing (lipo)protein [Mycobacteriaceae bacterium]